MLPTLQRDPKIVKRFDYQTNPQYGTAPKDRTIEQALNLSFININKPKGPTSHQVSDYIKHITKVKKAGHGGTLDPAVTGVLPVALNEAVKVVRTFLIAGKEYVCYMKLHREANPGDIKRELKNLVGEIRQLPPKKSAVKRDWRTRKIYYIEILDIQEQDILFKVGCQGGTYIRKLCTDFGDELEIGAHMQQLLRTKAATFDWEDTVTLQDVQDAMQYYADGNESFLRSILIPVEQAVKHLPKIYITDEAAATLPNGAPMALPGVVQFEDDIKKGQQVALFTLKSELVALASAIMTAEEMSTLEKGKVVSIDRIIMPPGTYPVQKKQGDTVDVKKEQ